MLKIIRGEAIAYLRLGVMTSRRQRVQKRPAGRVPVGVLFVHGLGANGGNFFAMKRYLENDADLFDTFEYFPLRDPLRVARHLKVRLQHLSARCERLYCIGHSLGGVLLRLALQMPGRPDNVAGYAAICSPLHGTWRSKLAPAPLRQLSPDSALIAQILASAHRLEDLRGRVLTVGARYDQFITPHTSALLDLGPQLVLDDVAHNGTLLDRRVHEAVRRLVTNQGAVR